MPIPRRSTDMTFPSLETTRTLISVAAVLGCSADDLNEIASASDQRLFYQRIRIPKKNKRRRGRPRRTALVGNLRPHHRLRTRRAAGWRKHEILDRTWEDIEVTGGVNPAHASALEDGGERRSSPSHHPLPRPWRDGGRDATLRACWSSTATTSRSDAGARRGAPRVRRPGHVPSRSFSTDGRAANLRGSRRPSPRPRTAPSR